MIDAMEPEPRRRRPLPDELADQLRRRISTGELRPGDRLPPERDLAQDLAVNRGSVREALRKLEQLRLVESQQGSGTRVLDPQHASLELVGASLADDSAGDWMRDLLDARELVAGGLLRAAVERGDGLADLERALAALGDEGLADAAFCEALWALPAFAARSGGNRVLTLLANALHRFSTGGALGHAAREACTRDRVGLGAGVRRVGVAVSARDAAAAEVAARDLFRRLAEATRRVLESPRPAGS